MYSCTGSVHFSHLRCELLVNLRHREYPLQVGYLHICEGITVWNVNHRMDARYPKDCEQQQKPCRSFCATSPQPGVASFSFYQLHHSSPAISAGRSRERLHRTPPRRSPNRSQLCPNFGHTIYSSFDAAVSQPLSQRPVGLRAQDHGALPSQSYARASCDQRGPCHD